MVVSVGVAGQIQGINLQCVPGAVAHIQNAVVGDVNGIGIQRGIKHIPASRDIISNRYGTVVNRQRISRNTTIFIDVQCRSTGQSDGVRNQRRITHVDNGTAVDAQSVNQRSFGGIPLGSAVQRHVEQTALINGIANHMTIFVIRGCVAIDTVG